MEYSKALEEMEVDGQFSVSQIETSKKDTSVLDNQLDIKVHIDMFDNLVYGCFLI